MAKRNRLKIAHGFTLIEMVTAMAVLVILMLLLFRFLASAQDVWSSSKINTRIYENARVAMELMQRELKTAVASNQPDREIPFYAGDPTVFVTATNLVSSGADSKLAEVTYYLEDNILYRRIVEAGDADWNFFGSPAGWEGLPTKDGEKVVRGVYDFSIESVGAGGNRLPNYVRISLTLFDENLASDDMKNALSTDAWQRRVDQTKRTFTKTIYLGSN